jgi:DNA-binding IscR family transcriptional regulator
MFFSNFFGYAVCSNPYLAVVKENQSRAGLGEIAARLGIPCHFPGKILKRLAKDFRWQAFSARPE